MIKLPGHLVMAKPALNEAARQANRGPRVSFKTFRECQSDQITLPQRAASRSILTCYMIIYKSL